MALMQVKVMFFLLWFRSWICWSWTPFECGPNQNGPNQMVPFKTHIEKYHEQHSKAESHHFQRDSQNALAVFYDFVLSALYSDAGPWCGIVSLKLLISRVSGDRASETNSSSGGWCGMIMKMTMKTMMGMMTAVRIIPQWGMIISQLGDGFKSSPPN